MRFPIHTRVAFFRGVTFTKQEAEIFTEFDIGHKGAKKYLAVLKDGDIVIVYKYGKEWFESVYSKRRDLF